MKNRLPEATADFDRAIESNPGNSVAMLGRGAAMLHSGQPDRAIVAFDRVIAAGQVTAPILNAPRAPSLAAPVA
jgi:predicted Zn-dependent protease